MDWKKFFDSLGLNGTRWQWRIMRWKKDWQLFKARLSGTKPAVSAQHKFCNNCGALLTRDEKECVRCQAAAPNWHAQKAVRTVSSYTPSHFSASVLMLGLIVVIGAAQIFQNVESVQGVLAGFRDELMMAGLFHGGAVFAGQYWRLITFAFLHGGMLHLAFNGYALTLVGKVLEGEVGAKRFFVVYGVTAIVSGLPYLVMPGSLVGASGALFGLIGFGISYHHFSAGFHGSATRNFYIRWAIMGLLFGVMVPNVSNSAHIAGFLPGLGFGFLVAKEKRAKGRFEIVWTILAGLLVLAIVASFYFWIEYWKFLLEQNAK